MYKNNGNKSIIHDIIQTNYFAVCRQPPSWWTGGTFFCEGLSTATVWSEACATRGTSAKG